MVLFGPIWSFVLGQFGLAMADSFYYLFLFRYLRTVVHFITGAFLYSAALEKANPRYTKRNVAVIIPTDAFSQCCESILSNGPRVLIIATVGKMLE